MTDTHAPITGSQPEPMFDTGPQPEPMFDTGPQPEPIPHTEPHHAPIFDTGPHPDPLRAAGDPDPSDPPNGLDGLDPLDAPEPALQSEPLPEASLPHAFSELDAVDTDSFLRSVTGHLPPMSIPAASAPAHPIAVAGSYLFLKRWKFALIVAGVWLLSAAAGLGFYYWWYTALDKTLPVFGILMYLVVCMVASILVSMVPNRPQVTALAIALMAAPVASTAAAAVLHGAYFFEWIARPLVS